MAIKLETKNVAPSAISALEITSGSVPSIALYTEEASGFVKVEGKPDQWAKLVGRRNQYISFMGADGSPCSLEGEVSENEAVEIAAAHKIVVEIRVSNELKQANAAGRKSKGYVALEVARVVEVWDSPKSCLWRAASGVSKPAGKEFDPSTGKIG